MNRRIGVMMVVVLMVSGIAAAALATDMDGDIRFPTGEWPDEHVLCKTCTHDSGNIVGAWQALLWADNFLAKCGSAGVDGWFGSTTKAATQSWQSYEGLDDDGIVGPNTWGRADNYLVVDDYHKTAKYIGLENNVFFYGPIWTWDFGWEGQWWDTDHPTPDFDTC
jgi:hypothetical protein